MRANILKQFLNGNKNKILHLRKGKNSIREIAKLTGVSVSTVQRVKAVTSVTKKRKGIQLRF